MSLLLDPHLPGSGPDRAEQFARRFTPADDAAPALVTPELAAEYLAHHFHDLDREHCIVVGLDARQRPLGLALVSIGSVTHTFMAPREVYRDAIAMGATNIIVAHNHPSGGIDPSDADIDITADLARTGDIINIPMVDHLILTSTRWTSMARLGLLTKHDTGAKNASTLDNVNHRRPW